MADVVKSAIHEAVAEAIESPVVPIQAVPGQSVSAAANALTSRIAAIPEIQNATNTETHWYQKRSFWSAIVSVVLVVAGPLLAKYGLPIDPAWQDSITTGLTTVGGLWAGYLAVRAGTATKPLGT